MASSSGGPEPLCGHCSTKFKIIEDSISCSFCKRMFHYHCVTGAAVSEDMIKFSNKTNTSIFWGCDICRAGIKRNKEPIYNENQVAEKLKSILDEKVSNKIQKIVNEHQIQKDTIQIQLNLIRGYKDDIKALIEYKEQVVAALDAAEINKMKINELQKEIENIKISHGNPAKRPRSAITEPASPNKHTDIIKELQPLFKKITVDITKNILETLRKETNIPTISANKKTEIVKRSISQTRPTTKNKTLNQPENQNQSKKNIC